MWNYVIPCIVGIVLIFFSGKIDQAFHGNRQLQKVILIFSGGFIILLLFSAFISHIS